MQNRDLILVLGYARSGTSALTRVMSLCGCHLPESVFGATKVNPTGHWESVESTNLNAEFASRFGIVGEPSMRLDEAKIDQSDKEEFIQRIQSFLSGCYRRPILIKDFQINELMEFWLEAAYRNGLSVKVVICVRHPQEVWASVKSANGALFHLQKAACADTASTICVEKLNTLWLKTNLQAERHSRGVPRVFVAYSNLLKDWRTEVIRMANALAIDLKPDEAAVDGFLTQDLYRQRYDGPITETFGYSWTTRVYAILSSAAQDGAIDLPSLDEIFHAYRANARAFRLAMAIVDTKSYTHKLSEFVGRLPVWQSERDF